MTLIEYCITITLLSFIMLIGLYSTSGFYNSLSISSQYNSVVRTLEYARDTAFTTEEVHTLSKNDLDTSAPLLTIHGPEHIVFTPMGNPESSKTYIIESGLYKAEIILHEYGIIEY